MDKLEIKGLSVMTRIGVHEWEKKILQKIIIDIELPIDCKSAQDTLNNTIDYHTLCQYVTEFIENNHFQLIETLAERIAESIKSEFNVAQINLQVSKPGAIKNAQNITVSVSR